MVLNSKYTAILCAAIVFNLAYCSESELSKETLIGCVKVKAAPLTFPWILKLLRGGTFYMPLSSRNSLIALAQVLKETPLSSEEELNQMCPTVKVGMGLTTISGFNSSIHEKCTMLKDGNIRCDVDPNEPPKAQNLNANQTMAWTDSRSTMLIVGCGVSGNAFWNVQSFGKKIDESTKKMLLEKVRELGFDIENGVYEYPYENC